MQTLDFILVDTTHANWPPGPAYRGEHSRKGYTTREKAAARSDYIAKWYAAKHGGGPVLNVVERERKPQKPTP